MDKKVVGIIAFVVLVGIVGFVLLNRPKETPKVEEKKAESMIKKVDLSTQPEWVQKLEVTATKGTSANGLKNVTVKVTGMPKDLVTSVNYIVQYETANKGSQGALSTKPIDVAGKTEFFKTIDFGTCSTKSCVTHEGVTAIELELDFTATSGSFIWSKTLPL